MSQQAVCVLNGKDVEGTVTFVTDGDTTRVTGSVKGLSPGEHGFHIHMFGDTTGGCITTGGHYNPDQCQHGSPSDPKGKRHAGDLGNITAGADGVANIDITDKFIPVSHIVGRAVVVHEGQDDFGLGGHDDSLTTGHAGGRVACGVIGLK